MNATVTATFRNYLSYAGNLSLSIDTSGDTAKIAVWEDDNEPLASVVELDADTARALATTMVAFNGSHSTWTAEDVHYGDIALSVEDGQVWLALPGFAPFDLGDGEFDPFVHDLAQRLIVWAGVDLAVPVSA